MDRALMEKPMEMEMEARMKKKLEETLDVGARVGRAGRTGWLLVALLTACGGSGSSTDAAAGDGGAGGASARELCMEALSHSDSCIAATGSTVTDCELEIGDFLAAGCRAEVEASLSCLSTATPDPTGFCPDCEAQQRAVSACVTR